MSLWLHNLKGISIANGFRPAGCDFSIDVPSIKIAAGEDMAAINSLASQYNMSIISGGDVKVSGSSYAGL